MPAGAFFWIVCKRAPLICPQGPLGEIFDKLRIQCRIQFFEKMSQGALNQVLTLPNEKMLQIPLKIIDLQNDFNILVAKQWKIRIPVPMSYMRLLDNLAVLEKWYLKGPSREPKWDLTGTWNGTFKGALMCKFERQFPLVNLQGESGALEAPYVPLLIRSIQRMWAGVGESPWGVDL